MTENDHRRGELGVGMVVVFYAAMTAAGLGFAHWQEFNVWRAHYPERITDWAQLGMGAGFGFIIVWLSYRLTPRVRWMRELSQNFADILGKRSLGDIAIFAGASAIGEEVFFRGCLQQWLGDVEWLGESKWMAWGVTTLAFGLMHIGPDRRKFLPWTLSATVLGGAIGLLYMQTGGLLAPIIAHFTINFFNLQLICGIEERDA